MTILKISRSVFLTSMLVVLIGWSYESHAQDPLKLDSVPSSEAFSSADDLAVPWRHTGCVAENKPLDSGCYFPQSGPWEETSRLTLFNLDGTVWFKFSIYFRDVDYFADLNNPSFIPFSKIGRATARPAGPILRLIGVSSNWYQVEINEETRETKFILKTDPSWSKVTWGYWLRTKPKIVFSAAKTDVLNSPDGDKLEYVRGSEFFIDDTVGDWARIGWHKDGKMYLGWIRWRTGRKILVGCVFNDFQIPDNDRK